MRSLPASLLLWAVPAALAGQGVVVAPHAVFIDHRNRGGFVELYNPEAKPVEVEITTLFGYPLTDSAGHLRLHTPEPIGPSEPSATDWIIALPRRMVVPPLARQTVRLLGRPPSGIEDREYWTRLVITARAGAVPVSGVDTTSGVRVGLTLEVRTIIPVYYRKGPVRTGIEISHLRAALETDSIAVRARLVRSGNAVFLGTVRGTLVDSGGRTVSDFNVPLAVYYDLEPRFTLGRVGLPPGQYLLRLEVVADRTDIPRELVLPARPVRDSVTIVLR